MGGSGKLTRRQWIYIAVGVAVLALFVVLVLYFIGKRDDYGDMVSEIEEEVTEQREELTNKMSNILGVDYEILTYDLMSKVVSQIEAELEKSGDVVTTSEIGDVLRREYGFMNAVAYSSGVVIEEGEDDFTISQALNRLLATYYFIHEPTLEEVTQLGALRTTSLMSYKNSIIEPENRNMKLYNKAFNGTALGRLLVSDTEGFKQGKQMKVGYVAINGVPVRYVEGGGEENKIELTVDVYIDDDITAEEFIKRVQGMEVKVEGEPIDLKYKNNREELIEAEIKKVKEVDKLSGGTGKGVTGDIEKGYKDYLGNVTEIAPVMYIFQEPLQVYLERMGVTEEDTEVEVIEKIAENIDGVKDFIKELKTKRVMRDTVITVSYEVGLQTFLGDVDGENITVKEIKKELNDREKPVVVEVDGVEIELEVATEKRVEREGIFYKK